MKIVINETGKVEKVSKKIASRLINKGKAHYPEKQKGNIVLPKKISKLKVDKAISESLKEVKIDEVEEFVEPIKKPKRRYRKKKSKFKDWEFD